MRKLCLGLLASAALAVPALAQYANPQSNQVRGYSRSDGTYVAPHYRTNPNSSTSDNYSSQGNTNPYTGQRGRQNNGYR